MDKKAKAGGSSSSPKLKDTVKAFKVLQDTVVYLHKECNKVIYFTQFYIMHIDNKWLLQQLITYLEAELEQRYQGGSERCKSQDWKT